MYQNFFATRLYTDAGSSDTTLTLETPPTVTSGRLTLEARNASNREIIGYTGISGNQVTGVTRGIGGTTAKAHIKGALVEMNVTAEDLTDALAVPNTLATQFKEALADFIVDNTGVVAQTVLLTGSFSDIGFYIDGVRYSQTSIPNNVYIASRDTYVDINNAGVVTYSDVALGAAAPALAANSIRVAKVTTSGLAITSVVLTSRGSVTGAKLADGSVTKDKLSTTAGELGGSWVTWTPTWTNLTVGNTVMKAAYSKVGRSVTCRIGFTLGSTGSSSIGYLGFTLPVIAHADYAGQLTQIGVGRSNDAGTAIYNLVVSIAASTTNAYIGAQLVNASYSTDALVPFNGVPGDSFGLTFTYEAAS